MKEKSSRSQWKSRIRFVLIKLVLFAMMALLINGGGYLFKVLEEHASIQRCQEAESNQVEYVQNLSTLIYNFIELNKTVWNDYDYSNTLIRSNLSNRTLDDAVSQRIQFYSDYDALIESKLIQFRDLVLMHKQNNWYVGLECANHSYWVYESAVLYSLTILTTIGYGHVTPITWEGQVVAVSFSIISIPIFLIAISNLASTLSIMLRWIYSILAHSLFKARKDDRKHSVPLFIVILMMAIYLVIGMFSFTALEDWSYIGSFYFAFITIATIGFGDYVPAVDYILNTNTVKTDLADRNLAIAIIYIIFGISMICICFDLVQGKMESQLEKLKRARIIVRAWLNKNKIEPTMVIEAPKIKSTRMMTPIES